MVKEGGTETESLRESTMSNAYSVHSCKAFSHARSFATRSHVSNVTFYNQCGSVIRSAFAA